MMRWKRSSGVPRAWATAALMGSACETATTICPGCRATIRPSTEVMRVCISGNDSPPGKRKVLGLRCTEGPVRVLHLVGDVADVTRAQERDEEAPAGPLGWKLEMTHLIAQGSFHGLIRLEDGRLYPISRDGGEDVFKSSWVHFSR